MSTSVFTGTSQRRPSRFHAGCHAAPCSFASFLDRLTLRQVEGGAGRRSVQTWSQAVGDTTRLAGTGRGSLPVFRSKRGAAVEEDMSAWPSPRCRRRSWSCRRAGSGAACRCGGRSRRAPTGRRARAGDRRRRPVRPCGATPAKESAWCGCLMSVEPSPSLVQTTSPVRGVEGVQENAHERPDAGGEVDRRRAVRSGDDRAPPRPARSRSAARCRGSRSDGPPRNFHSSLPVAASRQYRWPSSLTT